MQHLFNESLIKVNSSTVREQLCAGDSFRHQGHDMSSVLVQKTVTVNLRKALCEEVPSSLLP